MTAVKQTCRISQLDATLLDAGHEGLSIEEECACMVHTLNGVAKRGERHNVS